MTREIKLRAKITHGENSGKWKYVIIGEDAIGTAFSEKSIYFNNEDCIKKTVGQFTGLKDKNGKEIYEGDKIKNSSGRIVEVYWHYPTGQWDLKALNAVGSPLHCEIKKLHLTEIIGNIHE